MTHEDTSPYAHHDELASLLPWFVNGTLVGTEAERVREHLRVCLECRRELATQRSLLAAVRHEPRMEISPRPSFERLMARIEREDRRDETHSAATPMIVDEPRASQRPRKPARWRGVYALAASLTAVGVGLGVMLHVGGDAFEPSYRTVAAAGSLGQFSPRDVRIVFAERTPDQGIAELLHAVDAEIVDGPNAIGVYTVRLGDGIGNVAQAIDVLRRDTRVQLAEPAAPVLDGTAP
ncbi:MAG: zf-HC2 domain-containing protein [Methylotetracoccus sp.]